MKFQPLHESNALASISRMLSETAGQKQGEGPTQADRSAGQDAALGRTERHREGRVHGSEQPPESAGATPEEPQSEQKKRRRKIDIQEKSSTKKTKRPSVEGKPDEPLLSRGRQEDPKRQRPDDRPLDIGARVTDPDGLGSAEPSQEAKKLSIVTQHNVVSAERKLPGKSPETLPRTANKGEPRGPATQETQRVTFRDWYMNSFIDAFAPDLAVIQEQEGRGARVDMLRMCAEDVVDMFRDVEKHVAMHSLRG